MKQGFYGRASQIIEHVKLFLAMPAVPGLSRDGTN
jgi:hypothetical protein